MKHYYVALIFLCTSCFSPAEKSFPDHILKNELKYAKGFSLEHRDGKTYIEVYNPWNNYSLLASYVLTNDTASVRNAIKVPVQRTVCLSSTYLGMIALLGAQETVVASSNANWIYDSALYNRYRQNKLANLGNDLSMSAESVIAQEPDVIIKYIYQSVDPIDDVMKRAGISLVYIIEFMEEHPLGRAEWIKLIGALLGKETMADSIFNVVEENYLKYTKLAQSSSTKPDVLTGSMYKGTWYAAGGNSFIAQLIQDANANYFWLSDSTTGSIPLSFEVVIQKQGNADYWINTNSNSLSELMAIDSRCEFFKAFKEGNVYHYNKRTNENGGLDYYETGVVRPDLLLRDMLVILHPELIDEETVYYEKLEYSGNK
jgi:iron complex transport system substrate-binding protein